MIRVTALTSSRDDPSTRFRVRQFIGPLARLGINVSEHYPLISKYKIEPLPFLSALLRVPGLMASHRSDITWFGRELLSGRAGLEQYAGGRKLFDVDDAIWLVSQKPFSEEIAGRVDGVIAGNNFLAEHYRPHAHRLWMIPTSIDTDVWRLSKHERKTGWTIGWTGTWSNLKYLSRIEEPLAQFLMEHGESRLLVVSDRRPAFEMIPDAKWHFEFWSPENEVRLVQQMDAGLMPLEDSEWARGKCAFKLLSYMSVGLPVVASSIGANQDVLGHDNVGIAALSASDWYDALTWLFEHREQGAQMGAAGRRVVEEHYSVKKNVIKLAEIFREVTNA